MHVVEYSISTFVDYLQNCKIRNIFCLILFVLSHGLRIRSVHTWYLELSQHCSSSLPRALSRTTARQYYRLGVIYWTILSCGNCVCILGLHCAQYCTYSLSLKLVTVTFICSTRDLFVDTQNCSKLVLDLIFYTLRRRGQVIQGVTTRWGIVPPRAGTPGPPPLPARQFQGHRLWILTPALSPLIWSLMYSHSTIGVVRNYVITRF